MLQSRCVWRLGCHQHNPSTVTARLRRHMHVAQFAQNYTEYRRYSLVAFRHKGRIKHSTSAPTFPCRNHALRLPTNAGTKRPLLSLFCKFWLVLFQWRCKLQDLSPPTSTTYENSYPTGRRSLLVPLARCRSKRAAANPCAAIIGIEVPGNCAGVTTARCQAERLSTKYEYTQHALSACNVSCTAVQVH